MSSHSYVYQFRNVNKRWNKLLLVIDEGRNQSGSRNVFSFKLLTVVCLFQRVIYIYIYIYKAYKKTKFIQGIYQIYSFRCVCSLQCIGRTIQRLDARIKHVPTKIRLGNYFADHINNTYGSVIAEHLVNNRDCASSYNVDLFIIFCPSFYWVLIWLRFNIPFPS